MELIGVVRSNWAILFFWPFLLDGKRVSKCTTARYEQIEGRTHSIFLPMMMLSVPAHIFGNLIMMKGMFLFFLYYLLTVSSSFIERIMSGEIGITANQFPNFLYNEHVADLPSREEDWDVENGLLCSDFCLWVCDSVSWVSFMLI